MLHKSISLSLQRDHRNIRITDRNVSTYTDDGYVTQNNESNHSTTRKSSFKHKLFSLFKTHSKADSKYTCNTVDNNARCSLTRADSSHSTISNIPAGSAAKCLQSPGTNEPRKKFDARDRQLRDNFSLHSLTESIIDSINEQPCSSIKLPSTWITNIGAHLSNRALQPFLTSIPGLLGLKNHGNTCYVNVVVQCLAHIDSVAQYFSTKDYLSDLRLSTKDNSVNSKKSNGSCVDVVVAFSYLLQSLWQYTYSSKVSIKFCQLLTLHKTQFTTDSQQDAHELLLYILNLLHDNLTRPSNVNSMEESSFIYDRFCGWLSNEITCPKCGYNRKFRDKMLSLNLPIPRVINEENGTINKGIFYVTVINGNQVGEIHAFEVDKLTAVVDIRRAIAERLGCGLFDILLLELVDNGFGRFYLDQELIKDISPKSDAVHPSTHHDFDDGLYAVFIPNQVVDVDALPLNIESHDELYNSIKPPKEAWNSQSFIRLLVVHVEKSREHILDLTEDLQTNLNFDSQIMNSRLFFSHKHLVRFTNVLTVQAARKTKMALLRHSLSEQMCKYLNLRNITKLPKPQFLIEGSHLISEFDNYPLLDPSVTMALKQNSEIYGNESSVVRLVVVWPYHTMQMLRLNRRTTRDSIRNSSTLLNNSRKTLLHRSVEDLAEKVLNKSKVDPITNKITIRDCLRDFFGQDSVSLTESWNCPSCETTQQAHTEIKIESVPETLILMLKRFTNDKNVNSEDTLEKGNLLRNQQNGIVRRDNFQRRNTIKKREDYLNKLECFVEYPLENLDIKEYVENASDNENYLYNLVGVVNHRGNLSNGHYVAMCQNSIDNQWRMFDDDRVTDIPKSNVVNSDAYILFYKRHSIPSELNPDLNLHWSYRRLAFPDKIHRNQSPNPTNLYYEHRRYSDKELIFTTKDPYGTVPLTVSNNHNSTNSLNNRLDAINELEALVMSPHISSSSGGSLTKCGTSSHTINGSEDFLDISTITSNIVDMERYDVNNTHNGFLLKRNISNGSADSAHDDSGAVMSQVSSCQTNHKHQSSFDSAIRDHDECYSSLSTSPSPSSPSASKKLSLTTY